MNWDNSGGTNDAVPQGVYLLAVLPAGLTSSAFGFYGQTGPPTHRTTYSYGPGDTSGAVILGNYVTGGLTYPAVNVERTVPSPNTWTDAGGGTSWTTTNNWSLSHSANAGETACFTIAGLPGTVTLDGNQTAGSLWFDSTTPYTIAQGSGGTLSLSNTGTIWIDAGMHTISAPWQ